MKRFMLGALALTSVMASATSLQADNPFVRQRALVLSQQLSANLGQFSMQAEQEAVVAHRFGNIVLARRLEDVAYLVDHLSRSVSREIAGEIQFGSRLYVVARNLEALQFEFQEATGMILSLGQLPLNMQLSSTRARNAHVQLKNLLGVGVRPF